MEHIKGKLMEAFKKAKPIQSEEEKKAKMSVLDDLKKAMGESQNEKLSNVKKVSVMADSKEGLEAGLEKAKEVVEEAPEMDEAGEQEEKEEYEPAGGLSNMLEGMSDEECEKLMEAIAARKKVK